MSGELSDFNQDKAAALFLQLFNSPNGPKGRLVDPDTLKDLETEPSNGLGVRVYRVNGSRSRVAERRPMLMNLNLGDLSHANSVGLGNRDETEREYLLRPTVATELRFFGGSTWKRIVVLSFWGLPSWA